MSERDAALAAILARHRDPSAALPAMLGLDIAPVLGLSEAAMARVMDARPTLRRRLGRLAARRLGLAPEDIDGTLSEIPLHAATLARAAHLYAAACLLTTRGRILSKAESAALCEALGREAVTFALRHRARLEGVLAATELGEPHEIAQAAPGLFVGALDALGHPAARVAAAKLGAAGVAHGPQATGAEIRAVVMAALAAAAARPPERESADPEENATAKDAA